MLGRWPLALNLKIWPGLLQGAQRKSYSKINKDTFDLTGKNTIHLEKDLFNQGMKSLNSGKIKSAINIFEKILRGFVKNPRKKFPQKKTFENERYRKQKIIKIALESLENGPIGAASPVDGKSRNLTWICQKSTKKFTQKKTFENER